MKFYIQHAISLIPLKIHPHAPSPLFVFFLEYPNAKDFPQADYD